jgi:AcrR family transcriptional regulator
MTFDQRLGRLVDAAADVFAERGFHSTTMRDLARATGMSLAGMYHYVPGKDELLFRVQERTIREVVEGAEAAVADVADPVERLQRFVRHHVTYFAAHMAEMKVLAHEAGSLAPRHRDEVETLKHRHTELLLGILSELDGGETGGVPARVATYAVFGMMNWIYTWYDPRGSVTPPVLADYLARMVLHGVVPAVGASRDA